MVRGVLESRGAWRTGHPPSPLKAIVPPVGEASPPPVPPPLERVREGEKKEKKREKRSKKEKDKNGEKRK